MNFFCLLLELCNEPQLPFLSKNIILKTTQKLFLIHNYTSSQKHIGQPTYLKATLKHRVFTKAVSALTFSRYSTAILKLYSAVCWGNGVLRCMEWCYSKSNFEEMANISSLPVPLEPVQFPSKSYFCLFDLQHEIYKALLTAKRGKRNYLRCSLFHYYVGTDF